ncbi:MAG: UbiA family prenyltransferase [Cyanobacteria bacterium J06621_8]
MTTPEERQKDWEQREAELQARERELRLRELETEIYREHKAADAELAPTEPPLSQTRKHRERGGLRSMRHKIVKVTKFIGFVVVGIAVLRVGLLLGIWLTYLILAGIVAAIGYSIFLKDDK